MVATTILEKKAASLFIKIPPKDGMFYDVLFLF